MDEPTTTNAPAETTPGSTPQIPADATGTNNGGSGERKFTQAELDAAIKERLERAERKHKEAQDAATKTAAEQAAKEQGRYKELAEQWEPKAKRADELEKFVKDMLDAELSDVPEKMKAVVPEYDDPLRTLTWVRNAKAAGILARPATPNTDAASGAGDGSANNAAATRNKELEFWQRIGLTNAVAAATKK